MENLILDIKEKKFNIVKCVQSKSMSTLAKSHTTFPESLKSCLKDLKRNTLPLRLTMFNNAT